MGSSTLKSSMSKLYVKAFVALFSVAALARSTDISIDKKEKNPINLHYTVDMGSGNEVKLVCHPNMMGAMMDQNSDNSIAVGETNDFDMVCTSGDQSCHLSGKGQIEYGLKFKKIIDMMDDTFDSCVAFEDRGNYGNGGNSVGDNNKICLFMC